MDHIANQDNELEFLREYKKKVDELLTSKDLEIDHCKSLTMIQKKWLETKEERVEKLKESGKKMTKDYDLLVENLNKSIETLENYELLAETVRKQLENQLSLARGEKAKYVKLVGNLMKILECSICKDLPDKVYISIR